MEPVGVEAARRRLPELLDRAAAGERTVISRHGHPLRADEEGLMTCPESGWRYREVEPGVVRCLDKSEDEAL